MNHYKQSEELYQKLELLTQEDINNMFSFFDVCQFLNLPMYESKSGYRGQKLVKRYVEENFNIRHFKGQGWNKNNYDYSKFRKDLKRKPDNMRAALVALRTYQCEKCGLSTWLGEPITLEVHHIDGDRTNNELNNLQLLCLNCHSQTDNYRGRNRKKKN